VAAAYVEGRFDESPSQRRIAGIGREFVSGACRGLHSVNRFDRSNEQPATFGGEEAFVDTATNDRSARVMLRKVPEVIVFFWIIKVLATTVGETAADFLGVNLNLGLTLTSIIMGVLLAIALVFQFRTRRYIAGIYWLAVVLISIVGTLITDNLTDNLGVSLVTTTVLFSVALAVTFAVWFVSERTLSIHSIYTTKREAFYWLAILFTFALGTAAGDLLAEKLNVGYFWSLVIFASAIATVYIAYRFAHLNEVVSFWVVYILTRPLGASTGDLLSQARADGGLGLGTTLTSAMFLLAILAVVIYLAVTKTDVEEVREIAHLTTVDELEADTPITSEIE
jgi:uncharacterized membrane-anchored protein